MATELTETEMATLKNDLKKELKEYLARNKWLTRKQVADSIIENGVRLPGRDEIIFLGKDQVAEVLSEPLYPAEKKVGKALVDGASNQVTVVFDPADEILGRDSGTSYRITEDKYDGGYTVGELSADRLRVVKNIPSKKWAIAYAVHRLDRSQPPPPKFAPRERASAKGGTFHKVGDNVADSVAKYGDASDGIDANEILASHRNFLYGGKAHGVFVDGYTLILDKEAADRINDKLIKKDAKVGGEFSQEYVDDMLLEYKDKFPDYKQVIPTDNLHTWQIVGFGSLGYKRKNRLVVAYLSDGRNIATVDADKLAFIYENIPGIDKIEGSTKAGPFRFSRKGKVVAVIMPMFFDESDMPKGKIEAAVSELFDAPPRVSKRDATDDQTASITQSKERAGHEPTGKQADADVKDTDLQAIHDSRSSRSKSADESRSNALTLEIDDPRVDIWERDPGRADIVGIDTPRKSMSRSGSSKKLARKSSRGKDVPTQVRGLR